MNTILANCNRIDHVMDDLLPTTDAMICLGMHDVARRLLMIREAVQSITQDIVDMDRAALESQLEHNATTAVGLLQVGMELARRKSTTSTGPS